MIFTCILKTYGHNNILISINLKKKIINIIYLNKMLKVINIYIFNVFNILLYIYN